MKYLQIEIMLKIMLLNSYENNYNILQDSKTLFQILKHSLKPLH